MSNNKNNGFTLIELIIAMSIFTIVIFVGYKVINIINISIEKDKVIYENQISVNLVNKYITKDIEKSIDFKENYTKVDSENEYYFLIEVSDYNENNNDIKFIEYKVKLTNEKSNYSLTRVTYRDKHSLENKISYITLIENQNIISNDLPFVIERYEEGVDNKGDKIYKDIYSVKLDSGRSKKYSFDVSSRIK